MGYEAENGAFEDLLSEAVCGIHLGFLWNPIDPLFKYLCNNENLWEIECLLKSSEMVLKAYNMVALTTLVVSILEVYRGPPTFGIILTRVILMVDVFLPVFCSAA